MKFISPIYSLVFFCALLLFAAGSNALLAQVSDAEFQKAQESYNSIQTQIKQVNMDMAQASEAGDTDKYNQLKQKYEQLTQEIQKYKSVIQQYMESNREVVEVSRLYNEGRRLVQLGNIDEALKAFEQSISKGESVGSPAVSSTISSAYYMKGYCLLRKKQTSDAIQQFDKSVTLDPNNSEAFFAKANAHASVGQTRDAIDAYMKAVEIDPTHDKSYFNLGALYVSQDNLAKAEEMFRKAIQANAQNTKARESLGQVLVEQKKFSEAIPVLQKVVEDDAKAWKGYFLLARAFNGVGQSGEAVAAGERGVNARRYGGTYIEMGDAYLKMGDKAKAKECYDNAMRDRAWRETAKYKIDMLENADKYTQ